MSSRTMPQSHIGDACVRGRFTMQEYTAWKNIRDEELTQTCQVSTQSDSHVNHVHTSWVLCMHHFDTSVRSTVHGNTLLPESVPCGAAR